MATAATSAVILSRDAAAPGPAPPAAVAPPAVPVRVPQPVSLEVAGRIYVLRAGQEPWVLRGSAGYTPVGWSPDGALVLAERDPPDAGPALAAFPIGGNAPSTPVDTGLDRAAWSPDGRWIAARRGGSLVLARVGGDAARVAGVPPGVGPVAAWSPDSRRVAFAAPGAPALGLASVEGGGASRVRLTAGPAPAHLAWSPAGDLIAFDRGGVLSVVPAAGGAPRRLVAGTAASWSPDGARLAYVAPGGRRVGVVDAAGGRPLLMPGCGCDIPGSVPSVAWSAEGDRLIRVSGRGDTLVSSRPDGGDAVTVVRIRDRAATRVMWVPRPT